MIWFGAGGAVYVRPAYRVARLGAAICGALVGLFDITCSVRSCGISRAIASARLGVFLRNLGLPFDCMARRCARFGLVLSIWFPLRCGGSIASDKARHARLTASNA